MVIAIYHTTTLAEDVIQLKTPVILVVALRLGCLNHALLTYQHMQAHGCSLGGMDRQLYLSAHAGCL